MISLMSKKLSSFFAANGIIKQEDTEVYEYSLEILFSTLLNFIAVVAIAVIARKTLLTLFFLLGFIPLRLIAGGYHAETHFRCFLVLLGTYSSFLLIVAYLPGSFVMLSTILAVIISSILIFVLAPVEDKNKPVSADEKKSFKLKSRITIMFYSVLILIVLFVFHGNLFALSLSLGILSVAISLLATRIKIRIIGAAINA